MNTDARNTYYRTRDENGETVLCPMDAKVRNRDEYEECVEESTTGRYAANFTVVNR